MTEEEKMYCYTQSSQIRGQTGNIGYLRADMDTDGKGFFSTWNGFLEELNTRTFRENFDGLIRMLRSEWYPAAFLRNRSELSKFCFANPGARVGDSQSFGFRTDSGEYSYLMRLCPERGLYNLYCYCYLRERLDRHLQNARQGILFIDSGYRELFRIPDGGKIRIRYPGGEESTETCRYIDPYHFETGNAGRNVYHICEFAERLERCGAKAEPEREAVSPKRERNRQRDRER